MYPPPFLKSTASQPALHPELLRLPCIQLTVPRASGRARTCGRFCVRNDVRVRKGENLGEYEAYFVFREWFRGGVMDDWGERSLQSRQSD